MPTPTLGWKACQKPHNCEYATGTDHRDPLEAVLYIAIVTLFVAVTAVSKGWM